MQIGPHHVQGFRIAIKTVVSKRGGFIGPDIGRVLLQKLADLGEDLVARNDRPSGFPIRGIPSVYNWLGYGPCAGRRLRGRR